MKQILKAVCLACVLVLCCAIYSHATSGDITLGVHTATVETENTQHLATLGGGNGASIFATITNTGTVDIEIGENGQTIGTAGVQGVGQFTLKVGMTVPVILWTSFSFKSASAGQIVYIPYRG